MRVVPVTYYPPRPVVVDDELGLMRYCVTCGEFWPDDDEFWLFTVRGYKRCRACKRAYEAPRAIEFRARLKYKRERGLCEVGWCPTITPRTRCNYHAAVLS